MSAGARAGRPRGVATPRRAARRRRPRRAARTSASRRADSARSSAAARSSCSASTPRYSSAPPVSRPCISRLKLSDRASRRATSRSTRSSAIRRAPSSILSNRRASSASRRSASAPSEDISSSRARAAASPKGSLPPLPAPDSIRWLLSLTGVGVTIRGGDCGSASCKARPRPDRLQDPLHPGSARRPPQASIGRFARVPGSPNPLQMRSFVGTGSGDPMAACSGRQGRIATAVA